MLDKKLIEVALALTGKTMEDMNILPVLCKFSIQNFCYYLLSEEFITAYVESFMQRGKTYTPYNYVTEFAIAIHEYQKGNEEPLELLLTKIPGLE